MIGRACAGLALFLFAGAAVAQDDQIPEYTGPERAASAMAAEIRVLDKLTGDLKDVQIARGTMETYGRLNIVLGDCRYPEDDPSSDAYAWLEIRDDAMDEPAFTGWMVASSPALNALDHVRYDVWVLRCITV
ncbi:DUF2155 domain-containing protein [Roseicyclus sp. F158]|uniref:DUF2155 domain-containing protein n=1 Tax=Tropicimonas omnivorans TaxID=3075590 RepID=A0ABU3DI23_9RHOB|nr:DUF2155 domain-containing protein [Roseicyclus sp. F158]MDT0683375.1 DUF2155 domain-containing protein [Roseicyclus sp. F158]